MSALPSPEARLFGNVLLTSHGGGHDLHLRTLQRLGVTLVGHFLGADGQRARFARDLGASTIAPGLYFAGVHFLRKRKSSLLVGVGEDAAIVAGQIATTARAA